MSRISSIQTQLDTIDAGHAAAKTAALALGYAQTIPPALALSNHYQMGTDPSIVLALEFTVSDYMGTPSIQYKGANGNPAGPPDWTDIPNSGGVATLSMSNPTDQQISVRSFDAYNGQASDSATIEISANDYL
jgi:hypothetical protein